MRAFVIALLIFVVLCLAQIAHGAAGAGSYRAAWAAPHYAFGGTPREAGGTPTLHALHPISTAPTHAPGWIQHLHFEVAPTHAPGWIQHLHFEVASARVTEARRGKHGFLLWLKYRVLW